MIGSSMSKSFYFVLKNFCFGVWFRNRFEVIIGKELVYKIYIYIYTYTHTLRVCLWVIDTHDFQFSVPKGCFK